MSHFTRSARPSALVSLVLVLVVVVVVAVVAVAVVAVVVVVRSTNCMCIGSRGVGNTTRTRSYRHVDSHDRSLAILDQL